MVTCPAVFFRHAAVWCCVVLCGAVYHCALQAGGMVTART